MNQQTEFLRQTAKESYKSARDWIKVLEARLSIDLAQNGATLPFGKIMINEHNRHYSHISTTYVISYILDWIHWWLGLKEELIEIEDDLNSTKQVLEMMWQKDLRIFAMLEKEIERRKEELSRQQKPDVESQQISRLTRGDIDAILVPLQ